MQVADVLDLVAAQASDPEERLQAMFEWQFERSMTRVKLQFGVAATFVAAFAAGLLDNGRRFDVGQGVVVLAAAGVFTALGMITYARARNLHREFTAALQLLKRTEPLGSFLAKYRGGT